MKRGHLLAVGLVGGLLSAALNHTGCTTEAPHFVCVLNQDCTLDGVEGLCEPDQYCSFPTPECRSGRAYGMHAPRDIAHTCVPTRELDTDTDTVTDTDDDST